MKKYFKVYKTLLYLNFSNLSAYKANFINSVISSFVWGGFSIISILLLTSKTNSLYGWSRDELILLTAVYNIMIGFFHMIFSRNFERLSQTIHEGKLDDILSKPIDSQFFVSFRMINFTSIIRIILGLIFTIYYSLTLNLNITFLDILFFLSLLLFSIMLLYSIWFIITTLTIWFTNLNNLVDLMYDMNAITRFPQEMYKGFSEYVFLFLLPMTLIITTPVKVLILKPELLNIFQLMGFAIMFFIISRSFWKFALRYYTSASS